MVCWKGVATLNLEIHYHLVHDRDIVIVGDHALTTAGLTTTLCNIIQCSTGIPDFNQLGLFPVYYYTMDSWNDFAYTKPSKTNPLVHIPTKERALVEAMKYEYFNEGILIESLITYITTFYNKELLEEVADHFKLPRERLQYWLDEAEYERTHDES